MSVRTAGKVIVVALVAVIAGAGLCVFDTNHASSGDLYTSCIRLANGPSLSSPLVPTGCFVPIFASAYSLYPPDIPAPPPKA